MFKIYFVSRFFFDYLNNFLLVSYCLEEASQLLRIMQNQTGSSVMGYSMYFSGVAKILTTSNYYVKSVFQSV